MAGISFLRTRSPVAPNRTNASARDSMTFLHFGWTTVTVAGGSRGRRPTADSSLGRYGCRHGGADVGVRNEKGPRESFPRPLLGWCCTGSGVDSGGGGGSGGDPH